MATTAEIHTQVAQLYAALFGRAPDYEGLEFWTGLITSGQSLVQVADTMYATTPARGYYPASLSNAEIIASFYVNVLGRIADPGGLAFWTAKLDAPGATPGSVIVEMVYVVANYDGTDPDGLVSQQLFNNKVAVAKHYAESGGGVASATAVLSTVTDDEDTAQAVIDAIDEAGVNAPLFAGATVNGAALVLSYADAGSLDAAHPPAAGAFAVTVGGVARTVSSVTVDAEDKTVTLTLASAVLNGETVTVAYTDPTSANDASAIQDTAGNDAASLGVTAVTNNTPAGTDITPPVFTSATVNGTSLVMTYTDAGALDAAKAPAASAFAVTVAGAARTVSAVAVNADAKTVTLTLSSAVLGGQAVTVAYTDPTTGNDTNAIQDAAGNDAATLAATSVTNNTVTDGPVFVGATVNGATLVMTYADTSPLDPDNPPTLGAFSVKVAGATRAVTAVAIDAAERTVTLTLASAVTNGQAVTVAYTDPTTDNDTSAIQDVLGRDAATLAATTVTNNTPDTTAPVFASATVNGSTLVMKYTEANALDDVELPAVGTFTVRVGGVIRTVTDVAVDATAKTVTLTLASAVTNGQTVTVAYADPSPGNDSNAIQDDSGNDAATLGATAVTNNTPDTTAPVFASATVNGSTLVMTYTETNTLDATHLPATSAFTVLVAGVARTVSSVSVDAAAKTVTLTLASAVTNGQAVTVAYTDPTNGNDANAIQDAAGNDAASRAATSVTNTTPAPDVTAPVFATATVNGTSLVLTYTDANSLDATNAPVAGDFTVEVGGAARTVNSVAVNGAAKTVTLTLASAVANGETVTVAYADPSGSDDANAIQDVSGNDAASLATTAVTNNTPDTTAPVFSGADVNGDTLVLHFTELNSLDATNVPATGAFAVTVDTVARAVTAVAVDAALKTVTLTLASAVANGETVTVTYNDPTVGDDANAIQDAAGNDAATITDAAVTNDTVAVLGLPLELVGLSGAGSFEY